MRRLVAAPAALFVALALLAVPARDLRAEWLPSLPDPEPAGTAGPVGQPGTWQLLFADGFAAETLDPGKWATCYWWDEGGCTNEGAHELQWNQPANVSLGSGHAILRARRDAIRPVTQAALCAACDGRWYAYSSGMLSTGSGPGDAAPPRFAFRYGFAELRAWIPRGRGLVPAFWMLPVSRKSLPEIDVMIVQGQRPDRLHATVSTAERSADATVVGDDLSAGWHVYGIDWSPGRLVWYLDGKEVWRQEGAGLPAEPMYLLLTLAVGGGSAGPPDSSTAFPADFMIDHVRVWRRID